MREQPHYTNILTKEFFLEYYYKKRMSFPKIEELLMKRGYPIGMGTIYKYCKRLGFKTRNSSEARREWDKNCIDYDISHLTESILEAIDGFLLGDGCIHPYKGKYFEVGRLGCGVEHKEFCEYLMSFFQVYNPIIKSYKHKKMKSGQVMSGRSKHHPDLYKQYLRWYPEESNKSNKRVKQLPEDVRITPISVMMWYLGDGSVVCNNNSILLRLSTDGFKPERVEFLVDKLKKKNISCHRTSENRIMINAKGIPAFFNFIGRKSPISCYNYKFDRIPIWRFEAKRMKEIANEFNLDYNRLCYFIKIKKLSCYRLSEKGRPRFLSEHIEKIKELIKTGELF